MEHNGDFDEDEDWYVNYMYCMDLKTQEWIFVGPSTLFVSYWEQTSHLSHPLQRDFANEPCACFRQINYLVLTYNPAAPILIVSFCPISPFFLGFESSFHSSLVKLYIWSSWSPSNNSYPSNPIPLYFFGSLHRSHHTIRTSFRNPRQIASY